MLFLTMISTVYFLLLLFRVYFFHNIVSAEIIFLSLFIFYFLICQKILFYFILLIFIAILFFLPFFSILIAYIFRFFPIFILFPSKTYIFYYDNAGPPYRDRKNYYHVKFSDFYSKMCHLLLFRLSPKFTA